MEVCTFWPPRICLWYNLLQLHKKSLDLHGFRALIAQLSGCRADSTFQRWFLPLSTLILPGGERGRGPCRCVSTLCSAHTRDARESFKLCVTCYWVEGDCFIVCTVDRTGYVMYRAQCKMKMGPQDPKQLRLSRRWCQNVKPSMGPSKLRSQPREAGPACGHFHRTRVSHAQRGVQRDT